MMHNMCFGVPLCYLLIEQMGMSIAQDSQKNQLVCSVWFVRSTPQFSTITPYLLMRDSHVLYLY